MFGKILYEYRRANYPFQTQLAEALHIHSSAISKFELGQRHPTIDFLIDVSLLLKLDKLEQEALWQAMIFGLRVDYVEKMNEAIKTRSSNLRNKDKQRRSR